MITYTFKDIQKVFKIFCDDFIEAKCKIENDLNMLEPDTMYLMNENNEV